MRLVRPQPVGNRRDDLRAYTETFDPVVPGNVVRDQPKDGGQRLGIAAGFGIGQLLHGVDLVAQTEASDGPAGAGSPFGRRGGG